MTSMTMCQIMGHRSQPALHNSRMAHYHPRKLVTITMAPISLVSIPMRVAHIIVMKCAQFRKSMWESVASHMQLGALFQKGRPIQNKQGTFQEHKKEEASNASSFCVFSVPAVILILVKAFAALPPQHS